MTSSSEPMIPFERVYVSKIAFDEMARDGRAHVYVRGGVQFVDVMDLIEMVNESTSWEETQGVYRSLKRVFETWERDGDYQTLMLHEFDMECGVTFPAALRLMGILKCPGARLWRAGVEQVLRKSYRGDPAALDAVKERVGARVPVRVSKAVMEPVNPVEPATLSKDELLAALDAVDPEWLEEVTGQPGAKRAMRD